MSTSARHPRRLLDRSPVPVLAEPGVAPAQMYRWAPASVAGGAFPCAGTYWAQALYLRTVGRAALSSAAEELRTFSTIRTRRPGLRPQRCAGTAAFSHQVFPPATCCRAICGSRWHRAARVPDHRCCAAGEGARQARYTPRQPLRMKNDLNGSRVAPLRGPAPPRELTQRSSVQRLRRLYRRRAGSGANTSCLRRAGRRGLPRSQPRARARPQRVPAACVGALAGRAS
jgi:hypothetical protein